jgi:hypothetical protein
MGSRTRGLLAAGLVSVFAGPISAEEELTPEQAVDLVDWNRDGRVDRREYFDAMIYDHFFLDENKDGGLSLDEIPGADEKTAAAFEKADRDGNALLSSHEYVDARFDDFDVADENDDGSLSVEEVRKFEHLFLE